MSLFDIDGIASDASIRSPGRPEPGVKAATPARADSRIVRSSAGIRHAPVAGIGQPGTDVSSIHLFLYISRKLPAVTVQQVEQLMQQSRDRNYLRGLRGVLLFDGVHFAQVLIGFAGDLAPLAQGIAADRRHDQVAIRMHQPVSGNLLFNRAGSEWRAGFAPAGALASLLDAVDPLQDLLAAAERSDLR